MLASFHIKSERKDKKMGILKGIILPSSLKQYSESPYDTIVSLEDYKDVLAVGSDSKTYFEFLPCADANIVVATDYFNAAHLPEGFSGVISYLKGYTPSADIMNAVSNVGKMATDISVTTAAPAVEPTFSVASHPIASQSIK